jgi:hypothetical protein
VERIDGHSNTRVPHCIPERRGFLGRVEKECFGTVYGLNCERNILGFELRCERLHTLNGPVPLLRIPTPAWQITRRRLDWPADEVRAELGSRINAGPQMYDRPSADSGVPADGIDAGPQDGADRNSKFI